MTVPVAATRLTPPGFRHDRRAPLGDVLDGLCHVGRAASLGKQLESVKNRLSNESIQRPQFADVTAFKS
jgi:hypothetical protein